MRLLSPLAFVLAAACRPDAKGASAADGPEERPDDASMVAIGDSVFAFHRESGEDIPQVVGDALGIEVYNVAVSGAQLSGGEDPIPAQLPEGPWSWVLMDGGANDMAERCGCGACDEALDQLITADGAAGILAELAATVTNTGAKLAIMGYYRLPPDAPDFDGCGPWLESLSARQARLADANPAVHFVDASAVVDGTDLDLFFRDRVHPSVAGSAVIGQHIAEALRDAR